MNPVGSVLKDVRALGSSAPLRLAYEASKRGGLHAVLFRSTPDPDPVRANPVALGTHVPRTEEARSRCLADAEAIVGQGVRVFGTRVSTGVTAPWSTDPLTGRRWPERAPWWKIDIRSEERLSDVKYVWEAGRHRDLVILARAAVLEPDGGWLSALEGMVRRWCAESDPEQGVNWYSSLELALRAIQWNQVLALVGERLDPQVHAAMRRQLVASARHIVIELPYTVSSMKNNHLLGDGLGLVMLSRMFPAHPAQDRWRRLGDRLFLTQLRRHMHDDGSMIEDSLSYHRFVLEMLIVRVLLGGADPLVHEAMRGAADYLVRLGAVSGPVPQYGDWDEGRVLADSAPAGSVAGAALLARALSGDPPPQDAWASYDELAWYAEPVDRGEAPAAPRQSGIRVGDFSCLRRGPWEVWFKSDSSPSHGHADVTGLWVARDGRFLLEDPGTGTYNGSLTVRNCFRTSVGHSVWRPNGIDQFGSHRAFRWMRTVSSGVGEPRDIGDLSVSLAVHDAYVEDAGGTVARAVVAHGGGVVVMDSLPGDSGIRWDMSLPLGEDATKDDVWGLEPREVQGQETPMLGWRSRTYGHWEPSTWLIADHGPGEVVWGLGEPVTSTAEGVRIGELTLRLERTLRGAVLRVSGPGLREVVLRAQHD